LCRSTIAQQTSPPDSAWSQYGDVLELLAPDQAVAPMTVAEILIDKIAVDVWLEVVVAGLSGLWLVGGNDRRALIKEERDITLHADRVAEIVARRERDGSTAGRGRSLDGLIDGRRIERPAITLRAVFSDVVGCCCRSYPKRSDDREASGADRAKRSSSKKTAPIESPVARGSSQLKAPLVLGFASRSILRWSALTASRRKIQSTKTIAGGRE